MSDSNNYNDFFKNLDPSIFLKKELMPPSRISKIRRIYGATQRRFAALLGVKFDTYCSWEQGKRNPSSPGYALLCIAEKYPEIFLKNKESIIESINKFFL